MTDTAEQRVDTFDRQGFWNLAYAQLARLKSDPASWQDYMDEIAAFDALAGDGLEDEEPYYTPEEEREILATSLSVEVSDQSDVHDDRISGTAERFLRSLALTAE